MGVIGQEIEGYAVDQINARQVLHGSGNSSNRNTDQISVLNANSSWISLASGVSISGSKLTELGLSTSLEGMGLAKANVLFSGTSKSSTQGLKQKEGFLQNHHNSSYTYGDYGYSPMPGITNVDVKTLNRGSLKKATVKIKINNRQQFDIIDVLYLRLGYTVLLEWGNSLYTTTGHDKQLVEGTLLENLFFSSAFNGNRSYRDILTPISDQRSKHNGNYDALLGKVSNFNWSFNPDGSYDAEITIISLGDVIESLKLNIPTNKQLNAFILKVSGEITPVSGSGGDVGPITDTQKIANVTTIAKYLKTIGVTKEGAAGLIGNMLAESGVNPTALERSSEPIIGGTGGIGIVQWTAARRRSLEAAAGNDATKIVDLNFQLNYLGTELASSYSGTFNNLKTSTSIDNSTIYVLEHFEVPGTYINRISNPLAYEVTKAKRIALAKSIESIVNSAYL
jgi:hypothetical protein